MYQQNSPPVYIVPAQKAGGGRGAILIASLVGMGLLGGGYLLYSRYGLVRAKISDFSVDPTTVKAGDTMTANISWENVGVKPYAFDVVIFYGDIQAMTGWGGLIPAVYTNPLEKKTTTISVVVPATVEAQEYDAHAVICDATDLGGGQYRLDKVYAMLTKQDLVTVESGEAPPPPSEDDIEVVNFSLSKA